MCFMSSSMQTNIHQHIITTHTKMLSFPYLEKSLFSFPTTQTREYSPHQLTPQKTPKIRNLSIIPTRPLTPRDYY